MPGVSTAKTMRHLPYSIGKYLQLVPMAGFGQCSCGSFHCSCESATCCADVCTSAAPATSRTRILQRCYASAQARASGRACGRCARRCRVGISSGVCAVDISRGLAWFLRKRKGTSCTRCDSGRCCGKGSACARTGCGCASGNSTIFDSASCASDSSGFGWSHRKRSLCGRCTRCDSGRCCGRGCACASTGCGCASGTSTIWASASWARRRSCTLSRRLVQLQLGCWSVAQQQQRMALMSRRAACCIAAFFCCT